MPFRHRGKFRNWHITDLLKGGLNTFIFERFWYLSFCITYKSKSLRNNKKDKKIRTLEPFFIQRSVLLFRCWRPNSQKWSQNFEVTASEFNVDNTLPSIVSKMARANILKIASNQIFQILMGNTNFREWLQKAKCPQQWGVDWNGLIYFQVEDHEVVIFRIGSWI